MPRHPEVTAFRSFCPSLPASQHPTSDESRQCLAGSYSPDYPYHSTLALSPDRRIKPPMCSPNILSGSGCFAGSRGVKESAAEPSRVASLKTEGFAEYSRLVPAARVLRIQAIVLDLADIEDCPIAPWKMSRHVRQVVPYRKQAQVHQFRPRAARVLMLIQGLGPTNLPDK
jgi:hypothetical protein